MPKKKTAANAAHPNMNDNFIYVFMLVVLVEIVAVGLLYGVQKYYSYPIYMGLIQSIAGWTALVSVVLGVAGLAAACSTGKRLPAWIGGCLLLLAACAACIYQFYVDGVTVSYALVIGAGVLYLVSEIYPPECLILSGLSGVAAVAYYCISRFGGSDVWNSYTWPVAVVMGVCLALVLVMTVLAGKRGGVLKLGAVELRLWRSPNAQMLLYLVCVIWAALLALVFLLGATFAWYCVLVAALAIFALAVWSTIKLM